MRTCRLYVNVLSYDRPPSVRFEDDELDIAAEIPLGAQEEVELTGRTEGDEVEITTRFVAGPLWIPENYVSHAR